MSPTSFEPEGPRFRKEALRKFDDLQRETLERALGGSIGDGAWGRAQLDVNAGGIGIRSAVRVARPAGVASLSQCRAAVAEIFEYGDIGDESHPHRRGLPPGVRQGLVDALDHLIDERVGAWVDGLPPDEAAEALALVADAWDTPGPARQRTAELPRVTGGHEPLISCAGYEDPEAALGRGSLQRALCRLADASHVASVVDELEAQGDVRGARLLRDLTDSGTSHEWMWAIHPAHGPCLPSPDYVVAIRLRLGAPLLEGNVDCALCGAPVDRLARHALCCATGTSTSGHNGVRDEVLRLAHLADPAAMAEPTGLVTSCPALRPADVLTSAARPGGLAALDIGVVSPDAVGRGDDACEAMVRSKRAKYAAVLPQLEADGVRYLPVVFSCYGRPHPEAQGVLETLAGAAARRLGCVGAGVLLRRTRLAVGVQLWRRAAAMVRACVPAPQFSEGPPGEGGA